MFCASVFFFLYTINTTAPAIAAITKTIITYIYQLLEPFVSFCLFCSVDELSLSVSVEVLLSNEEIKYTLHPRDTEMENIDKMVNCGDPSFGGVSHRCFLICTVFPHKFCADTKIMVHHIFRQISIGPVIYVTIYQCIFLFQKKFVFTVSSAFTV